MSTPAVGRLGSGFSVLVTLKYGLEPQPRRPNGQGLRFGGSARYVEPHARPPASSCWRLLALTPELATPAGCGIQRAELLHAPSLRSAPRCVCDRRAEPEAESCSLDLAVGLAAFGWFPGLMGLGRATLLRPGLRANTPGGRVMHCPLWPQAWERSPGSLGAATVTASKVVGWGTLAPPASRPRRKDPTEGQSVLNNLRFWRRV